MCEWRMCLHPQRGLGEELGATRRTEGPNYQSHRVTSKLGCLQCWTWLCAGHWVFGLQESGGWRSPWMLPSRSLSSSPPMWPL